MPRQMMRTAGSSFDEELFDEVERIINQGTPVNSGIPVHIDDFLLGQDANTGEEVQYQRGQEVANTVSTKGWTYIVELLHKITENYKKEKDEAEVDAVIIESHRRWKVSVQIVDEVLRKVQSATEVPHPDDLPRE